MATQVKTAPREIILVEDAHIRPMMGNQVLESLPSRNPFSVVDPYILVHEATVKITPEMGEPGYDSPAPRVRQPLVRGLGLLEHLSWHGFPVAPWSELGWMRDPSFGSEPAVAFVHGEGIGEDKGVEPRALVLQQKDLPSARTVTRPLGRWSVKARRSSSGLPGASWTSSCQRVGR